MDGSIRINNSESVPTVGRIQPNSKDGKRKSFDPEALSSEDAPHPDEEHANHHEDTPVGHKPDDESGSHLDLTA